MCTIDCNQLITYIGNIHLQYLQFKHENFKHFRQTDNDYLFNNIDCTDLQLIRVYIRIVVITGHSLYECVLLTILSRVSFAKASK